MARIKRFEAHRFVGTRDDMIFYDTDDATQTAALQDRMATGRLYEENLVQSFAPDEAAEARNRGFSPAP